MEWWLTLVFLLGILLVMMASGLPVAFAFMLVNLLGVYIFWGGEVGLQQLILSIYHSVTSFVLLPIPLFVLMGEVLFHSGIASLLFDAIDKWLGRLPGRLGLEAIVAGTAISVLSGSTLASTAMLGSVLVPEMEKRGYHKPMSLGPILGSGGLAMMIPPSGLAIVLAGLAEISVGKTLIAGIIPGLLMAILYAFYIIIRCWLQPSIAPPYDPPPVPTSQKILHIIRYVLPLGLIIFLVTGVIFFGVCTPSEAAATGVTGSFILIALYGRLSWTVMKKSLWGTLNVTVMTLIIISAAEAFSQVLSFSGAGPGLVVFVGRLPLSPIILVIAMQFVMLVMGMFISSIAVVMIAIPLFYPIIRSLGLDPVWFTILTLLNMEIAHTSPPFGMSLFVMKGVAPPGTTMGDIYLAGLPFIYCDLIVMVLMIAFPTLVLWLPGLML